MVPAISISIGIAAAVGASICVFAGCTRLRDGRRAAVATFFAVILFALGIAAFDQWLGRAESVYATLIVMIIALTALPFIVGVMRQRPGP